MNILKAEIEAAAAAFLQKYHPSFTIPIPIEDIVELQLKLNIVPHKGLKNNYSVDGFLSSDLTELHIDEDDYMGSTNRSRFTLAHEVGHLILHSAEVVKCSTIEEWKTIILGMGTGYSLKETEAHYFAGCLLMPKQKTLESFEAYKKLAEEEFKKKGLKLPEDKLLVDFLSTKVAKEFNVSQASAQIRLNNLLK